LAPLAFRQESFVVLLSITPLLDGVLRLDIIAPFHTSGPPLLQFHLAIEQWGMTVNQATTFTYPIAFSSNNVLAFKQAKSNSNGNNYLMREAGIGIPNNISVSLPGTSPALSFYVFVIGW